MPTIDTVLPYLKVATAVSPFVAALVVRLVVGKNRITKFLLSLATTWFAVNVVLSPFMDISRLTDYLR